MKFRKLVMYVAKMRELIIVNAVSSSKYSVMFISPIVDITKFTSLVRYRESGSEFSGKCVGILMKLMR